MKKAEKQQQMKIKQVENKAQGNYSCRGLAIMASPCLHGIKLNPNETRIRK